MFIISEMLKQASKEADMTQEHLAEKIGTKKSYLSKIENGTGNRQLSTLFRLFEVGLNRRFALTFLQSCNSYEVVYQESCLTCKNCE